MATTPTNTATTNSTSDHIISKKSGLATFLLCLFLGNLGIHRFYVGKIGTGILMLLTIGGVGLWSLYDLISLVCHNFTDKHHAYVEIARHPTAARNVMLTIGTLFLIFFISTIVSVCHVTGGLKETAQHELAALRMGDYEKAYSYTSSEFQKAVSVAHFQEFIAHYPQLKNNVSASFSDVEFKDNNGTIKGKLKMQNGSEAAIEMDLIKENDQWKVLGIQVKS